MSRETVKQSMPVSCGWKPCNARTHIHYVQSSWYIFPYYWSPAERRCQLTVSCICLAPSTNADLLWAGPLETNSGQIGIEIQQFSITKIHLKMLSAEHRPFCLGLNVLSGFAAQKISNERPLILFCNAFNHSADLIADWPVILDAL